MAHGPVMSLAVLTTLLLAGCTLPGGPETGISHIDLGLETESQSQDLMALVHLKLYIFEHSDEGPTPKVWDGTVVTTWKRIDNPQISPNQWLEELNADAFGYQTGGLGPVFVRTIEVAAGCYSVQARLSGEDAPGLKDEESFCTNGEAAPATEPQTPAAGRTPTLGMVSNSAGSSTSQWTVKVSSVSNMVPLSEYQFVLATPRDGQIVADTRNARPSEFMEGYTMHADTSQATNPHRAKEGPLPSKGFQFVWTDIDGNGRVSIGDTLRIQYDRDGDGSVQDTFPAGEYTLQVLHTPTAGSAGTLPRTF